MSGQVRWFMPLIIILLLTTVGCSNDEQSQSTDTLEMIKVQLMVPDKVSIQDDVALQIKLTQGGQPVDDADHVQFQVWNEKDEPAAPAVDQGMMNPEDLEAQGAITAQSTGDGIYEANYAFEETGVYVVQVHVTAGAMHSMPRTKVTVESASDN
ncbi:FixH family protein [Paenibacillus xylanilyticus]|uniref:FixH family protein n=1 Tax=Paenibacillus xylanilyticus TaxID=248903 RepID=UPI003AACF46D